MNSGGRGTKQFCLQSVVQIENFATLYSPVGQKHPRHADPKLDGSRKFIQENFDKRDKKKHREPSRLDTFSRSSLSNSMEKSSQIAWKLVPLRHFYPLKVVSLIEVLLYSYFRNSTQETGIKWIQSNLDKRDSFKREKANQREVFCAF
jgi:hypothetical protein